MAAFDGEWIDYILQLCYNRGKIRLRKRVRRKAGMKSEKIPAAAEVSHGGCGDFGKTRI